MLFSVLSSKLSTRLDREGTGVAFEAVSKKCVEGFKV